MFDLTLLEGDFEDDFIIFWVISPQIYERGQGKRVKGMVKGSMSASIGESLRRTRLEKNILYLKTAFKVGRIPARLEVNYQKFFFVLRAEDYEEFFKNPRLYAFNRFYKELIG